MTNRLGLALFLGAGASVPYNKPTTRDLKNKLVKRYIEVEATDYSPAEHYLYSILNFPEFEDIEHILQCIKEIDDFFNSSPYGGKYLLEGQPRLYFQDPRRPRELSTF